MADRELRKMSRAELIEIIYALQQNEKTLRAEKENLQVRLEDRLVRMESAGSIAEAALSLNHIFEDAQKAAEQYLASVKENCGKTLDSVNTAETKEMISAAQTQAEEMISNAQTQSEGILSSAQTQSQEILFSARAQAEKIISEAEAQSREILSNAQTQSEEIISAARVQAQEDLDHAEEAWQKLERKSEAFKNQRRQFLEEATAFLHQHPELAEQMEAESKKGETK
ncbi:MAG: hypothetical protein LUH58_08315 [Lachnospiraceae bacterium]|nr:hypothetical protein [Lachnospiraceae bacterium]